MKETSFIEQNKEKWKRFQDLAATKQGEPEELADLYSDITDDLSYAQTFYNRRTVRVYLNQIAQGIHNLVHKERSESLRKFLTVWKTSLPLEIYRSRKHLRFAFLLTLFWAIIGAVSTSWDPDFARIVLGNGYVEQTFQNISKGDPLSIYQDESQLAMFLNITINNIRVAFLTFILGFFFTIGTHIFIFKNGVMLGAFQFIFHTKGVLVTAFLGIWIHGAFEISCIVIAGGAGITLGNGWLFPGSYTRLQSLQLSAKRGLKIMMSLVPFLICAGFLESYVTHNYLSLPEWSKWFLIAFCFAIIIGYYIIYPLYVARRNPELIHEQHVSAHIYQEKFDLSRLRNFGQLFADAFAFYRVHIGKIIKIIFLFALPLVIVLVAFQDVARYEELTKQYEYDWNHQLQIMMGHDVGSGQDWLVLLGWTLVFSILFIASLYPFTNQSKKLDMADCLRFCSQKLPGVWLGALLIYAVLFLTPWYWMFLGFFLLPLLYLNGTVMALGKGSFGQRFGKGFAVSARAYGNSLLGIAVFSLILFLFAQVIAFVYSYHNYNNQPEVPDLLDILVDFVKKVARNFTDDYMVVANIVRQLFYALFLFFMIPFFMILSGFIYYDNFEKNNAEGLRKSFAAFGKRRRNQETNVDFD